MSSKHPVRLTFGVGNLGECLQGTGKMEVIEIRRNHQLSLVVYPIIYDGSSKYIPGGFLPDF